MSVILIVVVLLSVTAFLSLSETSLIARQRARWQAWAHDAILRLLPTPANNQPPVTDAAIMMLIAQGTKAGVFEPLEHDLFQSILSLGNLRLSSIMTPRTEMNWLEVNDDRSIILKEIAQAEAWEIPVAEGNADNMLGTVSARVLLEAFAADKKVDLRQLLEPALFVSDTEDALFLLRTFRRKGQHVAILLDEFGGVTGAVTIAAIVEAIVGNIYHDGSQQIRAIEGVPASWEVDGLMPVDEFAQAMGVGNALPKDPSYATVAGLVIDELGHVPRAGEELSWGGLQMKVVALDGHRIDKLKVSRAA